MTSWSAVQQSQLSAQFKAVVEVDKNVDAMHDRMVGTVQRINDAHPEKKPKDDDGSGPTVLVRGD